jgi:hypothetical protein
MALRIHLAGGGGRVLSMDSQWSGTILPRAISLHRGGMPQAGSQPSAGFAMVSSVLPMPTTQHQRILLFHWGVAHGSPPGNWEVSVAALKSGCGRQVSRQRALHEIGHAAHRQPILEAPRPRDRGRQPENRRHDLETRRDKIRPGGHTNTGSSTRKRRSPSSCSNPGGRPIEHGTFHRASGPSRRSTRLSVDVTEALCEP